MVSENPAPPGGDSEFRWAGRLGDVPLPAVWARCQRLRFTGRMVLRDGARQAEVAWTGGRAQDGEEPAGFEQGEFAVEQQVPDLEGRLVPGIETSGALHPGLVQRLSTLCADFALCADLFLSSGAGQRAQVRFTYGKVEAAMLDGVPQMALLALAVLSGWQSGTFHLRLRPLFGKEGPAEAPLIIEKTTASRDFDVTGAIHIPSLAEQAPPPSLSQQATALTALPGASPNSEVTVNLGLHEEPPPAPQRPIQSSLPTALMSAPHPKRRNPLWTAVWVGLCGGTLAFLGVLAWRLGPDYVRGLRARYEAAPDRALRRPLPEPGRPSLGAARHEHPARLPEVPAQPAAPHAQAERGRSSHARAEIVLSGKGTVTINGKTYTAPRRVRVPAGPCWINGERVTLHEGEHHEVSVQEPAPEQ